MDATTLEGLADTILAEELERISPQELPFVAGMVHPGRPGLGDTPDPHV